MNNKLRMFIIVISLVSLTVGADKGKISGIVVCGKTGKPLIAANVYLKNTHLGNATDQQGKFQIDNIPPGRYDLVVDMIGYERKVVRQVIIKSGRSVNLTISLVPEPLNIDEPVTVTATRGRSLITEVPSSVDIISMEKMEIRNPQNLAEALQNIQGVFIKDYGGFGNLKSVSLRGSSSEQVLVLLDGQRLNDPQTGSVDFSSISMEGIEKIEVVRGGNSALYGADAVGGVINIITKKIAHEKPGFYGSVQLTGASFHSASLEYSIKYVAGEFNLQSSCKYLNSKGDFSFKDNYGNRRIRENADIESADFYLKLEKYLGNPLKQGKVDLSYKYYTSERGYPGEIEPYYYHARYWNQNSQFNFLFTRKVFNLLNDLRVQFYHYTGKTRYKNDEMLTPINSRFSTGSSGAEVQLKTVVHPQVSFTYGGGLRHDELSLIQYSDYNQRLSHYLFVLSEFNFSTPVFSNVSLVPSLRYDNNSDFSNRISPKIGMVINFGERWKFAFKANSGSSYRAPTFNDLYWPEDPWAKGNPDLKPEFGIDWDVGFRFQMPILGGMYLESSFFENRMHGLIIWQEEQGFWTPENLDNAHIRGLESSLSFSSVSKFLKIAANYTFLDARNLSDDPVEKNKFLIYRPAHNLNVSVSAKIKAFDFNYQYQFVSRRFTDKANLWDNSLSPYDLSNFAISCNYQLAGKRLIFSTQINNIFKEDYRIIKNMPMPGREYRFALKISF